MVFALGKKARTLNLSCHSSMRVGLQGPFGFAASGFGFRVSGSGFGFRVSGLGFRVSALGCSV